MRNCEFGTMANSGRETKNEANKRKEGIKSRLKSGELRLLKLKRPQAYIGLAHNIAEKDNDEAGLPVYLSYRKCTKCWIHYKATFLCPAYRDKQYLTRQSY
eukprot:567721_1